MMSHILKLLKVQLHRGFNNHRACGSYNAATLHTFKSRKFSQEVGLICPNAF